MSNQIIVICGFSSCGKDSITKYIADHYGYNMVVSTTSRPMREAERQSTPYHFVSKEKFECGIAADEFIEYRTYNTLLNGVHDTWYYGVSKNEIEPNKDYIVVLDMWGLSQFKKHFKNVLSFFIDVPDDERKNRAILNRSDFDETEWNRRLADDIAKFSAKEIKENVDYVVNNQNFSKCICEITAKAGIDI